MNAPVRPLLPSRQQIDALDDVEALESLLADVEDATRKIEVDLEFRSDGDLEWEARARSALTAHRICTGNLNRRLHRLRRPMTGVQAHAQAEAEARERQKLKAATTEAANRAALELSREKTKRQTVAAMEGLAFGRAFMDAAKAALPAETFAKLVEGAAILQTGRVSAAVAKVAG